MKKETLIAIILGIVAGIGIAFFLVQQSGNSPKSNDVILDKLTPTISLETNSIEPLIIQSPESEFVTDQDSVELTIAAPKNSLIVVQSINEEHVLKNSLRTFTQEIDLVPGENVIKISAYNEKNIDTRSLIVYSIRSSLGADTPSTNDTKATNSAQKDTKEDSTIRSLKEKIAKKVGELNQGNKNVVVGHISDIKYETIALTTNADEEFSVVFDNTITELYSVTLNEKESIDFEDLEKGDRLIVSGPSIENQISANIIYRQQEYIVAQGQIVDSNDSAFTIDVITGDKDEFTLDIEEDTTQRIMNIDTLALSKSGFSKMKNGDRIHFAILKPTETKKKVPAIRTCIIPQEFFSEEKPEPTPQ